MSNLVKCATCKTEKAFSEMQTCMQAGREYSVCDMNCMVKFYKGEIKPDNVVTLDLEEMGKLGMNPKEYLLHKGNLELTKQLAKANERVDDLERESAENLSIIEAIANGLSENPVSLCKGVMQGRRPFLNKFAIEQKIIGYYDSCIESGMNGGQASLISDIYAEQLRKEQE